MLPVLNIIFKERRQLISCAVPYSFVSQTLVPSKKMNR